ncbi:hypothetical protein QQF64_017371 [Cirrhinus molitorella]|uniref:Uncharacterized protein n=1 Tax=Cirrhinus molitorella TaxID=172907 RepID=A0ABR3LMH9_9TELE
MIGQGDPTPQSRGKAPEPAFVVFLEQTSEADPVAWAPVQPGMIEEVGDSWKVGCLPASRMSEANTADASEGGFQHDHLGRERLDLLSGRRELAGLLAEESSLVSDGRSDKLITRWIHIGQSVLSRTRRDPIAANSRPARREDQISTSQAHGVERRRDGGNLIPQRARRASREIGRGCREARKSRQVRAKTQRREATMGRFSTHLNGDVSQSLKIAEEIDTGDWSRRGDQTSAEAFLTVLPQGMECVVFSIDGSFAASVSLMGSDPKVRPAAVDVVRRTNRESNKVQKGWVAQGGNGQLDDGESLKEANSRSRNHQPREQEPRSKPSRTRGQQAN